MKRISLFISMILFCFMVLPLHADGSYTFDDLEKAMFANNTELRGLQEELNRSLLDVKDAKANRWPTIDVGISATYMANPPVGPIVLDPDELMGMFDWPSGMRPTMTGDYVSLYEGMESTQYQFDVTITQPLFTWGKINTSIDLYNNLAKAKTLEISERRQRLTHELTASLDGWYYLTNMSTYLNKQRVAATRLIELTTQAFENGFVLEIDVYKANVEIAELDVALAQVEHERQKILIQLRTLTGLDTLDGSEIQHRANQESYRQLLEQDIAALTQQSTAAYRPAIAALSIMEQAAKLGVRLSKSSLYWKPDIALVTSIGYGGSRFPFIEKDWYRQNDYSFNVSIGIKSTVWDGGKILNDIARSQSNQSTASIEASKAKQHIVRTIEEQYSALGLALTTADWHASRIVMLTEAQQIEQQIFDSGYGEETNVLTSIIDVLTAQVAYERSLLEAAICYHTIKALVD